MSSVRLGDAIAALAAAFAAAAPLAGVTVTQGSAVTAAADPEFIVVGHDGTLEADGSLAEATEAGTYTTTFIAQGSPPLQEETGTVNVVAVAQTGDAADLPARITEAQRLAGACDDACTDLRSGPLVFDSAGAGRLITRQAATGCAAMVSFSVTYSAPW